MKTFLTTIALMLLSSGLMAQSGMKTASARQTPNTSFGARVNAAQLSSEGQPIGGIVVKGGLTSSPNQIFAVTNKDGEFTFTVRVAGDYSLSIEGNPLYQGSGHSAENPLHTSLRAAPGNPIGGIIVKGGKNPGGSFFSVQADENGNVELMNLQPGSYTFQVKLVDLFYKSTSAPKTRK